MKNLIVLLLILAFCFSYGQPNPQESYPARIKAIAEQLKTDSLNYELIWERLEMNVNLLGGFGTHDEIFSSKFDTINNFKKRKQLFDEYNIDFNKIYTNIIKEKKYNIVEEGDFYLNRIWFYFNMTMIDEAIADARYLRDSASYSRYSERGDYYHNWSLYALFNLYVRSNQFKNALDAVNTMLDKKKQEEPEIYFCGHGSFLSYSDKIRLYEHFNANEAIIPFLKECCMEHFNWYLENAIPNEYCTDATKEQSFELLKLLIGYMAKYGDKELPQYERVYRQLSINNETLNPTLSVSQIKGIVSELE